MTIFDVDISSFRNKVLHCGLLAFLNCYMQGSSLIERKTKFKLSIGNQGFIQKYF